MNIAKLKKIAEAKLEELKAELTNIPASNEELVIETMTWIDAMHWLLYILEDGEDIGRHVNEILKREGGEEVGQ